MSVIALFLLVALLIPILGIVVDSPIGRALARRLEGPQETPPDVAALAKRVELLEAEVDDLDREACRRSRTRTRSCSGCWPIPRRAPPSHRRPDPDRRRRAAPSRPAVMVAAGILLSRLVGLVRNRVFAHYFGTSDAADAFNAAFRIPNFLQNLFGEGVLSASFIPVYARLRAAATRTRPGGWPARSAALLALVTAVAGRCSASLLTPC